MAANARTLSSTNADLWQHQNNLQRYGVTQGKDSQNQKVAVFQQKDWQRIQNSLSKYSPEKEKYDLQQKDRLELHAKSKALVKNWENTIEGQRLKKLQARNIKQEEEEKERQKIDIEEAKLQAEKRKLAIEKARQLQYFETDRVKGFHGALLLTEVLKERDRQIEKKNNKLEWQKERENYLVEQQRKDYAEALKVIEEQNRQRFEQALNIASFQKLQVTDKEYKCKDSQVEDFKEGQLIEEQNRAFQSAKDAINKQKRHYKMMLKDTYLADIATKKEQENQKKSEETLAEAENKKFIAAKREMSEMRKKKEHELFEAFQNQTQNMCDKLKAEMQQKVDDEDDRIVKTVAEREKRRKDELEWKEQAESAEREATNQHRFKMMSDAKSANEESLLKDKAFLQKKMKEDFNHAEKIREDKVKKKGGRVELQTFHQKQILNKREKVKKEKIEGNEGDVKNMNLLTQEEDAFQEYADQVIEEAKAGDRNPFPLLKAKAEGPGGGRGPKFEGNAGLRPSYIVADATGVQLPHYIKDESMYSHVYGHVGKSNNRLGFTWSA